MAMDSVSNLLQELSFRDNYCIKTLYINTCNAR